MKMQLKAAVALLGLTTLALTGCGGGGKTVKENRSEERRVGKECCR